MTATTALSKLKGLEVLADKPIVRVKRKRFSILVGIAYFWLLVIILAAITANILPIESYDVPVGQSRQAPSFESLNMLLGTDSYGRSLLSRCIYGARISLLVGTVAGVVGLVVGTFFGMLGGYFGRKVDAVVSLLSDAMLAFPPLILLLALSSILTPSVKTILIGLILITIPSFVRLARASTLSWSSREFVRAAQNLGASHGRILLKEILPNVLPGLIAFFPIVIAALIVAEGSLSFLGLGLPPPHPSWGGMINDGKASIETAPHIVLVPSVVIFLTVFALNQVGDHLRLRFDRTLHH